LFPTIEFEICSSRKNFSLCLTLQSGSLTITTLHYQQQLFCPRIVSSHTSSPTSIVDAAAFYLHRPQISPFTPTTDGYAWNTSKRPILKHGTHFAKGGAPSITIQLCNTPVLSLPNRGVGLLGGNLPMHARSQRISLLFWRRSRTADRPSPSPTSLPRPTLTVFHLHRSLVGRHIQ